jgi:hypothetical protein
MMRAPASRSEREGRMHARRIAVPGLLALALVALVVPPPALAGAPTPVKTTSAYESFGSGNAAFFAWTQTPAAHPHAVGAWYEPLPIGSGTPARLNATGDQGWAGQIDDATDELPWQRVHNDHSDIRLFDVSGPGNVALPAGVNTSKWEWGPSLSEGNLVFTRDGRRAQTLFVVDLSTGEKTVVRTTDYDHTYLWFPARIQGNWIAYWLITRRGWNAYEYDITNGTTAKVPNPLGKLYYGASPDLDGNVFLLRSGNACGASVRLLKWTPGGNPVVVYAFPHGVDSNDTSTYDDGIDTVTYVSFVDCSAGTADIDSFTDPTAAPIHPASALRGRYGSSRPKLLKRLGGGAS